MIPRILENRISEKINGGKDIVLVGARQVGKTTLLKSILKDFVFLFLDGDDPTIRAMLTSPNTEQIRIILADDRIVFIDEAQRIPGIGLTLKIISSQNRKKLSSTDRIKLS
jgi:hypothetical protein